MKLNHNRKRIFSLLVMLCMVAVMLPALTLTASADSGLRFKTSADGDWVYGYDDPFYEYGRNGNSYIWVDNPTSSAKTVDLGASHPGFVIGSGATVILTSSGGGTFTVQSGAGADLFTLTGGTIYVGEYVDLYKYGSSCAVAVNTGGSSGSTVYLGGTVTTSNAAGIQLYDNRDSISIYRLNSSYTPTLSGGGNYNNCHDYYKLTLSPGAHVDSATYPNGYLDKPYTYENGKHYYSSGSSYNTTSLATAATGYSIDSNTFYMDQNQNITVTASGNTYTVAYNANGGSGSMGSTTRTYDTWANLPTNAFSRTGYTFAGWATSSDGGVAYADGANTNNLTSTANETVTLYAKWTANTYTVAYDVNTPSNATGTIAGISSAQVTYDTTYYLAAAPTLTGWTFGGWYWEAACTNWAGAAGAGVSNLTSTNNGSVTLYAMWTANAYNVTYNANTPGTATASVTGLPDGQSCTYDTAFNLGSAPSLTGWTFGGWYKDAACNQYAGAADASDKYNFSSTNGGTVTLYAKWTQKTYTLTLNANGGKGGTTATVTYDASTGLSGITTPTRNGYNFTGYWTERTGGSLIVTTDMQFSTAAVDGWIDGAGNWVKTDSATAYAQWTAITYDIELWSYGYGGVTDGSGWVTTLSDVTYGSLTLPTVGTGDGQVDISRLHYTFVGWNIYDSQDWAMYEAGKTYPVGLASEQDDVVNVYAAWEAVPTYTVSYAANGGVGGPDSEIVYSDTPEYTFPTMTDENTPTRENYTFRGWALSSSAAEPMTDTKLTVTADVSLYAVWARNYTVTYNANGASGAAPTDANSPYITGSEVTVSDEGWLNKTGCRFDGWNTASNGSGTKYAAGATFDITAETVLYAQWAPVEYIVSFDAGGTGSMDDQTMTYGTAANLTLVDGSLTNGSKSFAGWATSSGSETVVYVDGQSVLNLASTSGATVTLYAVWTDTQTYYLTYDLTGGIGTLPVSATGDGITVDPDDKGAALIRTGYTFGGWNTSPDGMGEDYASGDDFTLNSANATLYAKWTANEYTVSFDAGSAEGISGSMSAQTLTYDTAEKLADCDFTKDGYSFLGWATSADGSKVYSNGQSVLNLCSEQGDNIGLYAVWQPTVTTVLFSANGGTGGSSGTSVVYGQVFDGTGLVAPTRYGYIFAGYFLDEDAGGEYDAGETLWFDEDMNPSGEAWDVNKTTETLTARWTPVSYTIEFVYGSTTLDTQNAVYDTEFTLMTAAELGMSSIIPEGQHLAGWSLASGSETVWYTDGQTISTGLTSTDGGTVQLFAVLADNAALTLSYDANGGTAAPAYSAAISDADGTASLTVTALGPTRDGYVFVKWNTQSNGSGTDYDANDEISITQNTTLYAVWRHLETYAVTYDKNTMDTVTGMPDASTKTEGASMNLSATIPGRDGYVFVKWNTQPNGTGTDYASGAGYNTDAALTLYAQWQRTTFTVTYGGDAFNGIYDDAANHVSVQVSSDTVSHGGSYTITVTPYTGYSGDSMSVKVNGTRISGDEESGVWTYTVNLVTADQNITVSGISSSVYNVTLPTGTGYTVSGNTSVTHGENYSFAVSVTQGYSAANMIVSANGAALGYTSVDGEVYSYTVGGVTGPVTITVNGVADVIYPISLPAGTGYTASGNATVSYGDSYTLTISLLTGYTNTVPVVTNNGAVVSGTCDGSQYTYMLENVIAVPTFKVTGVSANPIYTVSFYDQGSLYAAQMVEQGLTASEPTEPTRSGYAFDGWQKDGSDYDFDTTEVTGDLTLTSTWTAQDATVSFNAQGGTAVDSVTQANGTAIILPATTYVGHDLLGWAASEANAVSGIAAYAPGASYTVNGSAMLYAVWQLQTITVSLPIGTGYTVTGPVSVSYGGDYTFEVLVSAGYDATNLVVKNDSTVLTANSGTTYEYTIENVTAVPTISISVTNKEVFAVTFLSESKTYTAQYVESGLTASAPIAPTRDGYTFGGWYSSSEAYGFGTPVTAALSLTAKWEIISYAVTAPAEVNFSFSGGSTPVEHGGSYIFTVTPATGYNGANLIVAANGVRLSATELGGVYSYTIQNVTAAQTITISGVAKNVYTVTFEINDGTDAVYLTRSVKHGETVAQPENPSRSGFSFTGWNNGGTAYAFDTAVTANMTLTAQWEAVATYTITYNANGGSGAPNKQTKNDGVALTLSDLWPSKTGAYFVGWATTDDAASAEYQPGGSYTDDADVTLYAVWSDIKITVTLPSSGDGYTAVPDGGTRDTGYGGSCTFTVTIVSGYNGDEMVVAANGNVQSYTSYNAVTRTYTYMLNGLVVNTTVTVSGVRVSGVSDPQADLDEIFGAGCAEYAADGETIVLTKDVTLDKPFEITGDVTLDLNGFTLSGANGANSSDGAGGDGVSPIRFTENGASLTILSTAAGGEVKGGNGGNGITGGDGAPAIDTNGKSGTLSVADGVTVTGGDGGIGTTGSGGDGGSGVGGSGDVDVTMDGTATGGDGGGSTDGTGGNGGNGIETDGDVTLGGTATGGDGGDSTNGTGGNGGNGMDAGGSVENSAGAQATGGNGGNGETGGNGGSGAVSEGSIENNGAMTGGDGGTGTTGNGGNGGNGGVTTGDNADITNNGTAAGGNGGNSDSGTGGTGGTAAETTGDSSSITNNNASGGVTGGTGGSSTSGTGGSGGSGAVTGGGGSTVSGTTTGGTGGTGADGITAASGSGVKQAFAAAIETINVTGSSTLSALTSGGIEPFTYEWKNSGGSVIGRNSTVEVTSSGTYTLTVTDANSGTATATRIITVTPNSSSGGSGGGSSTSRVVTLPVVSGNGNTEKIAYTLDGGNVTLEYDAETVGNILNAAEKSENGNVTVDATAVESADEITIPAGIVTAIIDSGTVEELTFKTPAAEFTLDTGVLNTVDDCFDSSYDTLMIHLAEVEASELTSSQQAAIDDTHDMVILDLAATVTHYNAGGDKTGSQDVHELGGSVLVRYAYTLEDGQDPAALIVYYLDENGTLKRIDAVYENGYLVFSTTHFSVYVVEYCPMSLFTDCDISAWYHEGVDFVLMNGLFQGVSATTFEPHTVTSRAMIVTVLWRLAGEPDAVGSVSETFTDCTDGLWYSEAVLWAAQNGIVDGYGNGLFGPYDTLSREQMVTILYRYEQIINGGGFTGDWEFSLNYNDAESISNWAYEAFCWCVMNGIVDGTGNGNLSPDGSAERCQLAVIMQRYCE